jgi:hypothetical protein
MLRRKAVERIDARIEPFLTKKKVVRTRSDLFSRAPALV